MSVPIAYNKILKRIKDAFKEFNTGNMSLLLLISFFLWLSGTFYTSRLTDWALYSVEEEYHPHVFPTGYSSIYFSLLFHAFLHVMAFYGLTYTFLTIASIYKEATGYYSTIIFFYWFTSWFISPLFYTIGLTPSTEILRASNSSGDILLFLNKMPVWVLIVYILLFALLLFTTFRRKNKNKSACLDNPSEEELIKTAGKYSSYYVSFLLLLQIILSIFFKSLMTSPFCFFIYIIVFLFILILLVSLIANEEKREGREESFLGFTYSSILMPSLFTTLILGIYSRLYFDAKYFEISGIHLLTDFELLCAKFITNPTSYFLIFSFLIILISFLVMLIFKKKWLVIPIQLVAFMTLFLYLCQKDSFINFLCSVKDIGKGGYFTSLAIPVTYALPLYLLFRKNDLRVRQYNNSYGEEILSNESKIFHWFNKIIYWLKKALKRWENVLFFLTLLIANFVALTVGILWNSSFFYIFLVRY